MNLQGSQTKTTIRHRLNMFKNHMNLQGSQTKRIGYDR